MSFLSQPLSLRSLFGNNRKISDIEVEVVLSESTTDTLTITKQPVQKGTSITDHSFMEPTALSMQIRFEDNILTSLSDIYEELQLLQESREPFDVFTPKRLYESMLISSLGMTTDKQTENCLAISITFQEVIFVNVTTTSVPRLRQRFKKVTEGILPAGKKSIAKKTFNLLGGG